MFDASWPKWLVLLVCGVFGATGASWNGIYIAQITRSVAPEQVGHATGGALFVTFAGVMITPPLFGLLIATTGGFSIPLSMLGLLSMGVGAKLLLRK